MLLLNMSNQTQEEEEKEEEDFGLVSCPDVAARTLCVFVFHACHCF